jgi:hypothetical protein
VTVTGYGFLVDAVAYDNTGLWHQVALEASSGVPESEATVHRVEGRRVWRARLGDPVVGGLLGWITPAGGATGLFDIIANRPEGETGPGYAVSLYDAACVLATGAKVEVES